MSRYHDIITDGEIRALMNKQLLAGNADEQSIQILIDMEARIIFAGEAGIVPPLHRENELLSRLNNKFAAKSGLKWLFSGIVAITAITYLSFHSDKEAGKNASLDTSPKLDETHFTARDTARQASFVPFEGPIPGPVSILHETGPGQLQAKSIGEPNETPERTFLDNAGSDGNPFEPVKLQENEPLLKEKCKGEFLNRSGEKYKIAIDTIFNGIKRLEVNATICNINLVGKNVENITLKGELNVEMKGLVAKRSDYRILYERDGELLKVWIENKGKNNTLIVGSLNYNGYLNFTVPEMTDVILRNASGDIMANGLSGKVCEVEASYGNIRVADIHTPVKLRSASGTMDVQRVDGNVDASSSYGDQVFKDINGKLKTGCASGNVTVDHLKGDLHLVANYGNVNLNNIHGEVKVISTSGSVSGKDIEGGLCDITANYGNMRFEKVTAELRVNSASGDISLSSVSGKVTLFSGYGNQNLAGLNGDLVSKVSSGDIKIQNLQGNMDLVLGYGNAGLKDCKGDVKIISSSGDINGSNIELLGQMELKADYGNIRMNLKNHLDELSFDLGTSYGNIHLDKDGTKRSKENGDLLIEKGKIRVKGFTRSGNQWFN